MDESGRSYDSLCHHCKPWEWFWNTLLLTPLSDVTSLSCKKWHLLLPHFSIHSGWTSILIRRAITIPTVPQATGKGQLSRNHTHLTSQVPHPLTHHVQRKSLCQPAVCFDHHYDIKHISHMRVSSTCTHPTASQTWESGMFWQRSTKRNPKERNVPPALSFSAKSREGSRRRQYTKRSGSPLGMSNRLYGCVCVCVCVWYVSVCVYLCGHLWVGVCELMCVLWTWSSAVDGRRRVCSWP